MKKRLWTEQANTLLALLGKLLKLAGQAYSLYHQLTK